MKKSDVYIVVLQWLLHAEVQRKMPGEGRTFRRNTVEF